MRTLTFAKRNFIEIIRDILSFIFCIGFPIALLIVFKIISSSIPAEAIEQTPQFKLENLAPSICLFSYTFITLFSGTLISKDRVTSFQARLRTSPMRPIDFFLGYVLPLFLIAVIQTIVCYIFAFIFGLKFKPTIFLSILCLFPSSLIFISLGLILGSFLSDKAVGGVSSLIINFCAIFSGMFMPIDTMSKGFQTFTNVFPFRPILKVAQTAYTGDSFTNLIPIITIVLYIIAFATIAIFVFKKKISSDK